MRTDQPRQNGMDHWKGPHSGIIAATPGLEEYRQLHLAEDNPGLWPTTLGVETRIPADRKVDGVAEVTFQSALSPLKGRAQTKLAFQDEINVFRRTLLYAGPPGTSRWYDVAGPAEHVGARAVIYLRRRDGVGGREFRKVVKKDLVPALIGTGVLKELRTQTFLPWNEKTWNTPDVAHDNPADQRFHASLDPRVRRPGRPDGVLRRHRHQAAVADARPGRLRDPRLRRLRSTDLRQGRQDPPALPGVTGAGDYVHH